VERKAREAEEKRVAAFTSEFLHKHVSEDEIAMVRRLVQNAVKDGKMEAMVYSFPSDLCTDSGRAINNYDPNWPATLQGKAQEFFVRYEKLARPQGYKLKALVIYFPGGVPGDIGLCLYWAPPAVRGGVVPGWKGGGNAFGCIGLRCRRDAQLMHRSCTTRASRDGRHGQLPTMRMGTPARISARAGELVSPKRPAEFRPAPMS
jgi:hypothetical protein